MNRRILKHVEASCAIVASFDLYDTLVRRTVGSPEDMFRLVGFCVKRQRGDEKLDGFAEQRAVALLRAKEKTKRQEVTLDEIYAELEGFDEDELQALKACEILFETLLIAPIKSNVEALQVLSRRGYVCIIVSDMYLPSEVLSNIVNRLQIGCDALFVSSEYGFTKRSGALFGVVCDLLDIAPAEMTHIGDNVRSDYSSPVQEGVRALLLPRPRVFRLIRVSPSCELARAINQSIVDADKGESGLYGYGYRFLGPLLTRFVQWLYKEVEAIGADRVMFLARDGGLLMRAYERAYGQQEEACYLHVSRRACALPLSQPGESIVDAIQRLPLRTRFDVGSLLQLLGLDELAAQRLSSGFGIDSNRIVTKDEAVADEELMAALESMRGIIEETSREQHALLLRYLGRKGFSGTVALVDVGWNGTLQQELQRVAATGTHVEGFYIGVNQKRVGMHGLVFEESTDRLSLMMKAAQGLFEHFFLADEGSVLSYEESNGDVVPVFDHGHENAYGLHVAQEVQAGALDFVSDAFASGLACLIECCDACDVALPLLKSISAPSAEAMRLFGGITYFDSREYWLSRSEGLAAYAVNPRRFVRDFYDSGWKAGFLRETFRAPFGYGALYGWARKQSGRV